MSQKVDHYNVEVETTDGARLAWDNSQYPTFEKAREALALRHVCREEPRACKIIVVEVSRRETVVEMAGTLAAKAIA